jgi:hypothetical protein
LATNSAGGPLAVAFVEIKPDFSPLAKGLKSLKSRLAPIRAANVAAAKDIARGSSVAWKEISKGARQAGTSLQKGFAPAMRSVAKMARPYQSQAGFIKDAFGESATKAAKSLKTLGYKASAPARLIADSFKTTAKVGTDSLNRLAAKGKAFGGRIGAGAAGLSERLAGTHGLAGQSSGSRIKTALGDVGSRVLDKTGLGTIGKTLGGVFAGLKTAAGGVLKGMLIAAPGVAKGLGSILGGVGIGLSSAFGGVAKALGAGLKAAASTAFTAFKTVAGKIGSVFSSLAGKLTSMFGGVAKVMATGLAVGAGVLTFALTKTVLAASNLNETINKTKEAFGKSSKVVLDAADEMAKKYGIVKTAYLDAASGIGLIAKGAGLADKDTAKLATTFASLAADAASFYNISFEEALEKMRAGLVGESEPLRTLGVLLNEDAVKAEAFRLKIAAVGQELTEGQKVMARASLIQKGLATATGDLERTQAGLANKLREITGRITNLAAQIGQYFLPAAEAMAKLLSEIITNISGTAEKSSFFTALGESMKKAVEYLRVFYGNMKLLKTIMGEAIGNVGDILLDVFKTLFKNLMNFANYFGKEIGLQISVALAKALFGIEKGLAKAGIGIDLGAKGEDMVRKKGDNPAPAWENPQPKMRPELRGALDKANDDIMKNRIHEALTKGHAKEKTEAAALAARMAAINPFAPREAPAEKQRRGKPIGLKAVAENNVVLRKVKPHRVGPAEREFLDLKAKAAIAGPEGEAAKKELEQRKNRPNLRALLMAGGSVGGPSQSFGLEEFRNQIQSSIGSKNEDYAKQTADTLKEIKEGGVKINNPQDFPAVAAA